MSATPSAATQPFSAFASFLGSADVQKLLGLLQAGIGGLTTAEGKTFCAHISTMTLGAAYSLGIHLVDALRAKIGR